MEKFSLNRDTKKVDSVAVHLEKSQESLYDQYQNMLVSSPDPLKKLEGIAADIIVTESGMTVGKWIWQPRTQPNSEDLIKKEVVPVLGVDLLRFNEKRYEKLPIHDHVGQGGFGTVDLYRDLLFDRVVAIKFISLGGGSDREKSQTKISALKEAMLLDRFGLAYDIQLDDSVSWNPRLALIQEWIPGFALGDHTFHDAKTVAGIGLQVASFLKRMHAENVIHQDIKPDNIILLEDGSVKVIDYGAAERIQGALIGDASIAERMDDFERIRFQYSYTDGFVPPEFLQQGTVWERSDVYALGVTMYKLLKGQYPYVGNRNMPPEGLPVGKTEFNLVHLESELLGHNPQFIAIIKKMLAQDWRERYSSMDVVIGDLSKALDGMYKK